jgi:hypothetical protein
MYRTFRHNAGRNIIIIVLNYRLRERRNIGRLFGRYNEAGPGFVVYPRKAEGGGGRKREYDEEI